MDFDFSQGSQFVIVVENRRHKADFLEVAEKGTVVFRILERDHAYLGSHSGRSGCVFFLKDGRSYWVRGKISSPSAERAIVLCEAAVEMDRRVSVRLEVQSIPSQIKEPGLFRPRIIEAHLLDISRTGAKIAPRTSLLPEKVYNFETSFPCRHEHVPFSSSCAVRYCGMERGHLVSGLLFTGMTPESAQSLERYLTELQSR